MRSGKIKSCRNDGNSAVIRRALESARTILEICWWGKLLSGIQARLSAKEVRLVALPNLISYKNRSNFLGGRFNHEESTLMHNACFCWYSFLFAQALLAAAGFDVLVAEADGSFPIAFARGILPAGLSEWVDRQATFASPRLFGYQMVFTVRTKE